MQKHLGSFNRKNHFKLICSRPQIIPESEPVSSPLIIFVANNIELPIAAPLLQVVESSLTIHPLSTDGLEDSLHHSSDLEVSSISNSNDAVTEVISAGLEDSAHPDSDLEVSSFVKSKDVDTKTEVKSDGLEDFVHPGSDLELTSFVKWKDGASQAELISDGLKDSDSGNNLEVSPFIEAQWKDATTQTEVKRSRGKTLTSFFLFNVLLQFLDVGTDLYSGINCLNDEELKRQNLEIIGFGIIGVMFLPYIGILLLQLSLCCKGKEHSLKKSFVTELPFVNILRNLINFFHLTKMDLDLDRDKVNRIEEEAFNSAIFEAYLESAFQIMIQSIAGLKIFVHYKVPFLEKIVKSDFEEPFKYIKIYVPIVVSGVCLSISSTKIFFSKRKSNKFYAQDQSISFMSFTVFLLLLLRNGLYVASNFLQILVLIENNVEPWIIFIYLCTTIILTPLIIICYQKIFRVKFDLLLIIFSTVNAWICPLLGVDTTKHHKYLSFLLTFISNVLMIAFCFLPMKGKTKSRWFFHYFWWLIPLCILNSIIITPILLFIAHRHRPTIQDGGRYLYRFKKIDFKNVFCKIRSPDYAR